MSLELNSLSNKVHKDTRLLATALVDIFPSASFDEGPFDRINQDIYVFIPTNEGKFGGLTIAFEKAALYNENTLYKADKTKVFLSSNQQLIVNSTLFDNSRAIILPQDYSEADANQYIASAISQIASLTNTSPDEIYSALEKASTAPDEFDKLSKVYRKMDEDASNAPKPEPAQP